MSEADKETPNGLVSTPPFEVDPHSLKLDKVKQSSLPVHCMNI